MDERSPGSRRVVGGFVALICLLTVAAAFAQRGPQGPKGDPGASIGSLEQLNGLACRAGGRDVDLQR